MKTFVKHLAVLCFLLLMNYGNIAAQTVYATENGKKYHAKNCSLAKTGKKGITLAEAKKGGLEPCKACKADAIKPEEKKPAAPKPKAKAKA
jgi:hypothetical protein